MRDFDILMCTARCAWQAATSERPSGLLHLMGMLFLLSSGEPGEPDEFQVSASIICLSQGNSPREYPNKNLPNIVRRHILEPQTESIRCAKVQIPRRRREPTTFTYLRIIQNFTEILRLVYILHGESKRDRGIRIYSEAWCLSTKPKKTSAEEISRVPRRNRSRFRRFSRPLI